MKNDLRYRFLVFLSLAMCAASLTCCIMEDRSQCEPKVPQAVELSVTFTDPYQSDDPQRGLNTDEFSHVSVFIYDRIGQLVTTTELFKCKLYEDYRLDVELSAGNYDMVVWAGAETYFYNFDHTENIDVASLSLNIPESHEIDFRISHLYYGINSFTIYKPDETVVVPILQYTNDINYTVTGLENDHQYSFWIVDDNGKYSFKNSYLPCDRFGYHSDALFYKSEQFKSRITMMRLSDGRNPVLYLTDDLTGEILYPSYEEQETNLIALIKAAYQLPTYDFDARHIFDLSLVFDADMKATVYIDNWEIKESVYEI